MLDEPRTYEAPSSMPPNEWALSGVWLISTSSAALTEPGAPYVPLPCRDLDLVIAR